jgi:RNA polymerase sigma-70 factor (ECF subfamily)
MSDTDQPITTPITSALQSASQSASASTSASLTSPSGRAIGPPITERVLKHWIERLTPSLIQRAYGICHDRHRAEELVQESFVRLWRSPPEAGEVAISSWMRTTVTNLAISSIRGKKRMWTLIDESGVTRDVRAESPHVSSERREDLSRVAAALERLDPDKRAMIMLRVHEGLSYEAIATHLGVPIGTVMSRLNRARLALLGELEHTREPSAERPSEFNINRARG